MKLSILIAAYNEEQLIDKVLKEIQSQDLSSCGIHQKEIILIDDGSTDKTVEKARSVMPELRVIHHAKRKGKGASLISAYPQATGDIILIQDADLEYRPSSYPALVNPLVKNESNIVYGSRFLDIKHPEKMKLAYFLANRFGTGLTNLLNGTRLTDAMTCFKVFRKSCLSGIEFSCNGFGHDSAELTARFAKKGFKIKEVPITYKARTFKEGKKFHPIYSLGVLWDIIKYSLS